MRQSNFESFAQAVYVVDFMDEMEKKKKFPFG